MLTAACFGFNMGARPTGSRVCTPTMTAADDYNLLVSRFGSQVHDHCMPIDMTIACP